MFFFFFAQIKQYQLRVQNDDFLTVKMLNHVFREGQTIVICQKSSGMCVNVFFMFKFT